MGNPDDAADAVRCPTCGTANAPSTKFCTECGTSLGLPCPECHFRNPSTAQICSNCGHELNGASGAERRHLTVFFADLVGSTTLSEALDPEELRDLYAKYQAISVEAVQRYSGHLAQYLGDGISRTSAFRPHTRTTPCAPCTPGSRFSTASDGWGRPGAAERADRHPHRSRRDRRRRDGQRTRAAAGTRRSAERRRTPAVGSRAGHARDQRGDATPRRRPVRARGPRAAQPEGHLAPHGGLPRDRQERCAEPLPGDGHGDGTDALRRTRAGDARDRRGLGGRRERPRSNRADPGRGGDREVATARRREGGRRRQAARGVRGPVLALPLEQRAVPDHRDAHAPHGARARPAHRRQARPDRAVRCGSRRTAGGGRITPGRPVRHPGRRPLSAHRASAREAAAAHARGAGRAAVSRGRGLPHPAADRRPALGRPDDARPRRQVDCDAGERSPAPRVHHPP